PAAQSQLQPTNKRLDRGRIVRIVAILISRTAIFEELFCNQTSALTKHKFDFAHHLRIFAQEVLGILTSLTKTLRIVGEPGTRLLDDASLDAEIDDLTRLGDALPIHDVEFDLLEGRSQLVLHHLDAGLVAHHLVAILDRADATNIQTDRSIELQRITARGRLW